MLSITQTTPRSLRYAVTVLCSVLVNPLSFAQFADSVEFSLERLDSQDTTLSLASILLNGQTPRWESNVSLSFVDYSMDFEPASFDLLGQATHLSHTATILSVSANRILTESIRLNLSSAYRNGFANYRSLWLDTYFDQHFAPLEGVPGHELYENFQPSALSITSGLEWEYIPANSKLSASVARIQDNVSPGYEIDFDGIRRSDIVLATTSLRLENESIVTRWLRSRFALAASETTAREPRYSAEVALNAALNDRTTLRAQMGGSTEDPKFEAFYYDLTLHYLTSETLSFAAKLRSYRDTGEIEDALLYTTASPELHTNSFGIEMRYERDNWRLSLGATYSDSNYTETNANVDFFQSLYRDRDWTNLRFAFSRTF